MIYLKKLYLLIRAVPKTIYFNFRYFNLKDALKCPVLVSHRVNLAKTRGQVKIEGEIKPAMIKIGFGDIPVFDASRSRSIWHVGGEVIFKGTANIGHGSKISVGGRLILGDNFKISAESSILCANEISFGDNCLLSWDTMVMDSDFHKIFDLEGHLLNRDNPINIGNNVWIGCRCLILKGSSVEDNTIVGANTTLSKHIKGQNAIIAGTPANKVRENVYWEM